MFIVSYTIRENDEALAEIRGQSTVSRTAGVKSVTDSVMAVLSDHPNIHCVIDG
jgi:hypothetical protein